MTVTAFLVSCILVVVAGCSVAFQQVLNANLRASIGSPWWAGVVSYAVGLVAISAVALLAPGPRFSQTFSGATPSLTWTGGVFGATFIAIVILMVPRLGAATTLALLVVGQMLASLALDHFGSLGLAQHPVNPTRLAGAALLIVGVVLVRA